MKKIEQWVLFEFSDQNIVISVGKCTLTTAFSNSFWLNVSTFLLTFNNIHSSKTNLKWLCNICLNHRSVLISQSCLSSSVVSPFQEMNPKNIRMKLVIYYNLNVFKKAQMIRFRNRNSIQNNYKYRFEKVDDKIWF